MHNKEAANTNLQEGGLQRYVSKELTHFLGKDLKSVEDQYQLLITILGEGQLRPFGYPADGAPNLRPLRIRELSSDPNEMINPSMICFCDIPIADLHIHIAKYSELGLSFLKSFLVEKGANPVFYVAQNSNTSKYSVESQSWHTVPRLIRFKTIVSKKMDCEDHIFGPYMCPVDPEKDPEAIEFLDRNPEVRRELRSVRALDPCKVSDADEHIRKFYDLTSFYHHEFWSFVKFFDSRKPDSHKENFYMEREWRILGRLDFSIDDVHRIILPKSYAQRLRHDVPEYFGQLTFSDYL